jgi:serine protease AprX
MRISAQLLERIAAVPAEEHLHVIIRARWLERDLLAEVITRPRYSLRHEIRMLTAFSLALPRGEVEKLAEEPWVEYVEEDEKVYAFLDQSLPLIGVPQLQDQGLSGEGIKVAIIDSGIDRNHTDFEDRIIATKDFTLEGFKDLNGHGTHISGIISGSGKSSDGRFKGIAPQAQIISAKVLKGDGSGRMSDVMAAIEWAVELGVQVINLSLGTPGSSDGNDALSKLCDKAVEQGTVVCVAAGNYGPERRTIGSPGAARRVITVGAVTKTDLVADFSSRGPTADERLKPEVVAPGVEITSTRAKGVKVGSPINEYYTIATGTSMAAPHVSGIVALLLEAKPEASPQLIKEALMHTARDLNQDEFAQGAGCVQALEALEYVKTHENPPEPSEEIPRSGCLNIATRIARAVVDRFAHEK